MSKLDLEAIKRRREAAMVGPANDQAIDIIRQDIPDLIAEVKRLRDAAKAYQELSICYRLSKRPNEALFTRLEKARKLLEES